MDPFVTHVRNFVANAQSCASRRIDWFVERL